MSKPIADCSVVVAGGPGSTAARSIAQAFAAATAHAVLAVSANVPTPSELADARAPSGVELCRVRFDDPGDVERLVEELAAGSSDLDIWVNDFPVVVDAVQADAMDPGQWTQTIESTLSAPFWCCQAAGRAMLKQGEGTIVNVLSSDAYVASAGFAATSTAMAGVKMMTEALAVEWASGGVRVIGIAGLGPITRGPEQRIPLKRHGTAAELAESILFLAGPEADYINGEVLPVDGGWATYRLF